MNDTTDKSIRVLLVDDHPPLRIGLRILLEQAPGIDVVGEAEGGAEALRQIEALRPDVAVVDCELSAGDGPTVAAGVQSRDVPTQVLALSAHDDSDYVQGMLDAGAVGYLLKNEASEVIVAAVRAAARGKGWFSRSITEQLAAQVRGAESEEEVMPTPREAEVLALLAQGLTNVRIADDLGISESTVAYHVENLLNKLGSSNRTEAVVEAIRRGWIEV